MLSNKSFERQLILYRLYGITNLQVFVYFKEYRHDTLLDKLVVCWLWYVLMLLPAVYNLTVVLTQDFGLTASRILRIYAVLVSHY